MMTMALNVAKRSLVRLDLLLGVSNATVLVTRTPAILLGKKISKALVLALLLALQQRVLHY